MKFVAVNHYQQIRAQITFWAKLYQGQGSTVRHKIWLDIKLVSPRSVWLHRFYNSSSGGIIWPHAVLAVKFDTNFHTIGTWGTPAMAGGWVKRRKM